MDSFHDSTVNILLVDDDPAITGLGETLLERESNRFRTKRAGNGEEALEVIQGNRFDVDGVVSDFEMPVMNGVELLEDVRTDHENLPFYIYTGRGSEEIASEAVKHDVTSYMQKSSSPLDDWKLMANKMLRDIDQEKLQSIQEAMLTYSRDIITVVDTRGDIVYTSPASERLLGYENREREGTSVFDYIHHDDVEEVMGKLSDLQESTDEETIDATFRYMDADGNYITLESVGSYQPGKFDGIIVNSRKAGD